LDVLLHSQDGFMCPITFTDKAARRALGNDNFRMNTGYGRYGATYNMVVLIANFCAFE
jgi:hypothetical protein